MGIESILNHQRQVETPAAFFRQGHADQAAAVPRHEIDVLGLAVHGGNDEITFILAILVVHDDDHLAAANLVYKFLCRIE